MFNYLAMHAEKVLERCRGKWGKISRDQGAACFLCLPFVRLFRCKWKWLAHFVDGKRKENLFGHLPSERPSKWTSSFISLSAKNWKLNWNLQNPANRTLVDSSHICTRFCFSFFSYSSTSIMQKREISVIILKYYSRYRRIIFFQEILKLCT